jgi:nucleoside-diphosphate-sugar epimerase
MTLTSMPVGTLNLLEATRRHAPDCVFAHLSTNKVYGDRPNTIRLKELSTRWDYDDPAYANGIAEDFPIDQSKHSLFGASKVAGDVMVQEYGRYFGLRTCCLRGGCLTGPNHSGVELHGFLSYLIKCNVEGKALQNLWLQGQAGARQHTLARRGAFHPCVSREAARRRGLQHRRRPRQERLHPGSLRARGGLERQ